MRNESFRLAFLVRVPNIAHLIMSSQPTESTGMIQFLAWVEVNQKKLLIGALVVGVVIGANVIYQWRSRQVEAGANAALLRADRAGAAVEVAAEPNAQAFLEVASAYRGTSAAGRALLLAGEALFREGKYAEAKSEFESFSRDYPEHRLGPTAALGVAACLDAMNKTNEALSAYQQVASRFSGAAVVPQAKLEIARIHEAMNEPVQALRLYEEMVRLGPQSAWGSQAAVRRELLLSRHPELARTNAPAAVASSISNALGTNVPALTGTNPVDASTASPK